MNEDTSGALGGVVKPKSAKSNGKSHMRPVGPDERDPRPDIVLSPEIHRTTEAMISALASDPDLYQRSNSLVHVIRTSEEELAFAPGTLAIRHVPLSLLRDRVSTFARCVRFSESKGSLTHVPPPSEQVRTVLDRGSWSKIRPLIGVTEAPILRPDGSVCQTPGYDKATGYLYEPNIVYPLVDEHPTQEDAVKALADLLHVFADFPYISPGHASVPIAALLSVLARPAIRGAVPAFAFDASTRGSGKTLQCDVVSLIASGRTAARANYPEKDEELEKVLSAYAVAGARLILLDNVTRTLGGGPLDAVLTCRDDVEFRILGKTEIVRLPWRAIIMTSGNNLCLGEDTTRRCLMARLESPLESPEERTDFVHPDLVNWTLAERPRLIHAALTILRAYTAKGCPEISTARWGSFEEWSRLIPGAILFAQGADPMGARATQLAAVNDTRRSLLVLVDGLKRLCAPTSTGNTFIPITARNMIAALYPDTHGEPRAPDGYDELRDILEQESNCLPGRKPEARRIGKWLQKVRGRVVDGWCVTRKEGTNNTACWMAIPTS